MINTKIEMSEIPFPYSSLRVTGLLTRPLPAAVEAVVAERCLSSRSDFEYSCHFSEKKNIFTSVFFFLSFIFHCTILFVMLRFDYDCTILSTPQQTSKLQDLKNQSSTQYTV